MVGRTIALLAAAASLGLIGSVYVSQRQAGERLDRLRQLGETSGPLAELESRQARLVRGLEDSTSCANEHVLLGTRRDASVLRVAKRDARLDQAIADLTEEDPCDLEAQRSGWSRIVALSRRHRLALKVELRRSRDEERQSSILTLAAAGCFGFTIAFLALVRRQRYAAW
jgi:hypothetical protein